MKKCIRNNGVFGFYRLKIDFMRKIDLTQSPKGHDFRAFGKTLSGPISETVSPNSIFLFAKSLFFNSLC